MTIPVLINSSGSGSSWIPVKGLKTIRVQGMQPGDVLDFKLYDPKLNHQVRRLTIYESGDFDEFLKGVIKLRVKHFSTAMNPRVSVDLV